MGLWALGLYQKVNVAQEDKEEPSILLANSNKERGVLLQGGEKMGKRLPFITLT